VVVVDVAVVDVVDVDVVDVDVVDVDVVDDAVVEVDSSATTPADVDRAGPQPPRTPSATSAGPSHQALRYLRTAVPPDRRRSPV
jgi:hypothetical protein